MNQNIDYICWKNWEAHEFGTLDANRSAYFDAELKPLNVSEGAVVLEIGFGNGQFLAFGKRNRWQISGTEVNLTLVETAKNKGFDAHVADELGRLADSTFDLVAAFDVLEHVPEIEHVDFLASLIKKLKIGGVLLLRFPNGDSPMGLPNQNGDPTHCSVIGVGKLKLYANLLNSHVLYIKGEARPLSFSSVKSSIVNMMYHIVFPPIEWFLKKILYPSKPEMVIFSENIVVALRREL